MIRGATCDMDFRKFVERVWALLEIDGRLDVEPTTSLHEDLGFDSVRTLELLLIVESLVPSAMLPGDYPDLRTVGDAFDYYVSLGDAAV